VRRPLLPSLAAACLALTGAQAASAAAPVIKHARVGRISIGYRMLGHGRPLVMIVGYGLTMAEWDPRLLDLIAAHRRVIVFDNRGAGTTTDTRGNQLTVAEMADDTDGLIRALGLRQADVLGWSMGSYIAQELVLRHPGGVRRVVLASADPGSPHTVQPSARVVRILQSGDPDQLLSVLFPPRFLSVGRAWYARIGAQGFPASAFEISDRGYEQQTLAVGPRWDGPGRGSYARLPLIRRPVLIGAGAGDVVVPPANDRLIARRIPGARLVLFPGAGHAFLFQAPGRFADRVDAFLG
jgi:pimeloyl-ACP methyl ester carboxylesterase